MRRCDGTLCLTDSSGEPPRASPLHTTIFFELAVLAAAPRLPRRACAARAWTCCTAASARAGCA